MKVKIIILSFLILIAVIFSCKKKPETPTDNKIELGETVIETISYFDAHVSTEILNTGGNKFIEMGHCWGLNHEPTFENSESVSGVLDSVTLISELTGLGDNTAYFIRPFITSKFQTIYGQELIIETLSTRKPIVTTDEVTNITINTVTCGGTNDDGGIAISQRGVCWNTTDNPTLENNINFIDNGNGVGSFSNELTGLTESTIYYIAAFATNEKGTSYGDTQQFTTLISPFPEVSTKEVTNITNSSASCGGDVSNEGGGNVTARGVCYNTTGFPILTNCSGYTINGAGSGSFFSQLFGLPENTTYYIAAYATNDNGTVYGEVRSFVTTTDFTDPRDGQSYETVVIGSHKWMAENLNYQSEDSWWYDNSSANGDIYGRLYTWEAATTACPDGWHLPTDDEWKILEGITDTQYGVDESEWDSLGYRGYDAGRQLKTTHGWTNDGNGTDAFGFSALPGGYGGTGGIFNLMGDSGNWWSSSEKNSTYVWGRRLYYFSDKISRDGWDKSNSLSVRCIKN